MARDEDRCDRIRESDRSRCPNIAEFLACVGTRTSDAERACANHLSKTVRALLGAEGRSAVVTVTRL